MGIFLQSTARACEEEKIDRGHPFLSAFDDVVIRPGNGSDGLSSLTFKDVSGKDLTLPDMRAAPGDYLLVNFWALWCPPCLEELPSLLSLKEQFAGKGWSFAFISLDFPKDGESLKKAMAEKNLPPLTTAYAEDPGAWGRLESELGVEGLPTTLLIAPDGHIMYTLLGNADWATAEAVDFINAARGQPAVKP